MVNDIATARLVKLAVKRDMSVPVGQPAPCHLDCRCGTKIDMPWAHEVLTCNGCGNRYDRSGWQLHAECDEL